MEVLKNIPIFPNYRFSNMGRVWSTRTGTWLKPLKTPNGYLHVVLSEHGTKQRFAVHRLIATAFHGNPTPPAIVVNHINNDPSDNRARNLEWCTQSHNVSRAYATGRRSINAAHRARCAELGKAKRSFSDIEARMVRSQYTGSRGEITLLAKRYGLSRYAISNILKGA